MKNKFVIIYFVLLFILSNLKYAVAEEFIFEVTDLDIIENGNVYKGNNRGKVTTDTQLELISDNFEYLKIINRLEANGNVRLIDAENELIIDAEQMFYFKNEERILTVGKTLIKISDKYNIEGYDLTLLKDKMILLSEEDAIINDIDGNIYELSNFKYLINQEILKGKNVKLLFNSDNKKDKYFFETGFFDLKESKFLGKDLNIKFHKNLFADLMNDPRINAASGYGNEFNTYLEKAVFTSCKKTDKCPPWKMRAQKMRHDKVKKQIIYKNAFLYLYDFPVAYFPKFFHPDPSVKRQSGLLRPEILNHDTLGDSVYLPYFFVLSDSKDFTLKPRFFNDDKVVLQGEYRQKNKNSYTIIDSSITTGHDSSTDDLGDTRSHLFTKTFIDLDLEKFISSSLEFNYEKISNDNYLNLFKFIKSSLWDSPRETLTSLVRLQLETKDTFFSSSFELYETLSGLNSDRYTYVLPNYNFSRDFFIGNLPGSFLFQSDGYNVISETNISETKIGNDLSFSSFDSYTYSGIKKKFSFHVKNSNSMSDNSIKYKNTPQSELMSAYYYNLSFPLEKSSEDRMNTLTPKLSLRLSPHDMKDNSATSRRIDVGNAFSENRLSLGDSFETGESITLGIDFKKDKVTTITKIDEKNTISKVTEIEDYIDFRLATVLRFNKEKYIPIDSSINEKHSNYFGSLKVKPNKNIILDYNFSLTNDFDTIEYNALSAEYILDNFSTKFSYIEEQGILGNSHIVDNNTQFTFKDYNSITFGTRRDIRTNLTEYYDLIYEFKNDCLIAGIQYRKDYYNDKDIVPVEELFFSITIVPFYTFSPDKMILNKNRKS